MSESQDAPAPTTRPRLAACRTAEPPLAYLRPPRLQARRPLRVLCAVAAPSPLKRAYRRRRAGRRGGWLAGGRRQVLHYNLTQQFQKHHDYFDPATDPPENFEKVPLGGAGGRGAGRWAPAAGGAGLWGRAGGPRR